VNSILVLFGTLSATEWAAIAGVLFGAFTTYGSYRYREFMKQIARDTLEVQRHMAENAGQNKETD